MGRADYHFEMDEWLGSRSQRDFKIMIVDFNTGGASFIPIQQSGTPKTGSAAAGDDSSTSFSSQSWQASIKQSAEPRADKVAQASALANNSSYPTDSDLNRLANFLSSRI